MCEPATIGAIASVGSSIAGYQAEVAGVRAENKARLKNFERQNVQYLTDAMLDKMEAATREMYENDYAGTMTGATAARLAGKSTKEMGFKKSEYIAEMFLAEKDKVFKDESARDRSQWRSWELYEKVRYAPIHGHAPVPPLLKAKPSMAGALFGAVGAAAGAFGD
jgi:hypothetical protein